MVVAWEVAWEVEAMVHTWYLRSRSFMSDQRFSSLRSKKASPMPLKRVAGCCLRAMSTTAKCEREGSRLVSLASGKF